jgi:hypothetical protein
VTRTGRRPPLVREAGEGCIQHGGFADLSLAADRDEWPALQHVENDTGESVAMACRHEYVARVGRRGERITRELIKALVHPAPPLFRLRLHELSVIIVLLIALP